MGPRLLIARNPDPDSKLPYLLRLPIEGGLVLKVRDTWPRTARVFCARVAEVWPEEPEIVEDVAVVSCVRRGVAVDLVLDRPREFRSQLVFTTLANGREAIFWQTRKVVGTARPGARIPGRRASGIDELEIVGDTRERYPYRFAHQKARAVREALPAGDYAVRDPAGRVVAAVERKALADLAAGLSDGTLVFELAKLAELPRTVVVVEDRYSALVAHAHAPGGFLRTCSPASPSGTRRSPSSSWRRGRSRRSGPTDTSPPRWPRRWRMRRPPRGPQSSRPGPGRRLATDLRRSGRRSRSGRSPPTRPGLSRRPATELRQGGR